MYLLQQFCEYVNDTKRNILFITTLHQNFNAYAKELSIEQKQEWTKVKGRLQEIVFQEPVEQLLKLAAVRISEKRRPINSDSVQRLYELAVMSKFLNDNLDGETVASLYPMDIFSAYILTLANQRYGQNERTLFSFLESKGEDSIAEYDVEKNGLYNLAKVHDYIVYNFYSYLSDINQDSANWQAIKIAIERVEGLNLNEADTKLAIDLVKALSLLSIFASSATIIDKDFLNSYFKYASNATDTAQILQKLEKAQIIRYAKYKSKYILFEGTDIDIELELSKAALECPKPLDYIDKLKGHFNYRVSLANAYYYKTGTARYFEYRITDTPITVVPKGEIDGYINLLFVKEEDLEKAKSECLAQQNIPIVYCLFRNSEEVINYLYNIDKLQYVREYRIDDNDKVANREIENLKRHNAELLNKCVGDSLYSSNVEWYFNGVKKTIEDSKQLVKFLSYVSKEIFSKTPVFKNELVNKHKPSGTVSLARQNFLNALLENSDKEDLGFAKDKFPPEKSLYLTLLKNTGIHKCENGSYSLDKPTESSFLELWEESERFLKSCQSKVRKISELNDILSAPPYGLKQGLIECWIPTFLIMRRNDYALYQDNKYIPVITKEILELLQRTPKSFAVKSFSVDGVNQRFFDKYREAINKSGAELNSNTFIETIRPFIAVYRRLNPYARQTKDISSNAIKFRDTIANATDPEETFFKLLPEKLGFKEIVVSQEPEKIETFTNVLKDAVRSLQFCYDEFIDSIEMKILSALNIKDMQFEEYKEIVDNRYRYVKKDLLPVSVKNFHSRLTSKFDEKKQWIEGICYTILNRPLDTIKDSEKAYLLNSIQDKLFQLDDYVEMHKQSDDLVLRLHITQNNVEPIVKQVVLPKEKEKEIDSLEKSINELLSDNNAVNMAALISVLQKKLL